jgi:glutaredoxin
MEHEIRLYTQPLCGYCDIIKEMLDKAGYVYYTIDITKVDGSKRFLKERNHKTVPQLYVGDTHVNKKDTLEYSIEELSNIINQARLDVSSTDWPEGNGEQEF